MNSEAPGSTPARDRRDESPFTCSFVPEVEEGRDGFRRRRAGVGGRGSKTLFALLLVLGSLIHAAGSSVTQGKTWFKQ